MATTALGIDNFFTTTLTSGITSTDTTIPLNALPSVSEGYIVIEPDSSSNREIIYFTSKTGSAVVCPSVGAGRGQGGTTGVSHSVNSSVKMNVVAEYWEALKDGTAITDDVIIARHIAGFDKSNLTSDVNPYKFFAYRNGAQTVAGGPGVTKIQFETELFDTNSNYDSATNYRYTAPVTGFYQFNANLTFNNGTAANVDIGIGLYKNGSRFVHGNNLTGVAFPGVGAHALVSLTAGDYIEVYAENGNANTSALYVGNNPLFTYFSGYLISRT